MYILGGQVSDKHIVDDVTHCPSAEASCAARLWCSLYQVQEEFQKNAIISLSPDQTTLGRLSG